MYGGKQKQDTNPEEVADTFAKHDDVSGVHFNNILSGVAVSVCMSGLTDVQMTFKTRVTGRTAAWDTAVGAVKVSQRTFYRASPKGDVSAMAASGRKLFQDAMKQ